MILPRVKEIAVDKGWEHSKGSVFGYERGFLVNLYDVAGSKVFQINLSYAADDQIKSVEEEFKKNTGGFKKVLFLIQDKNLVAQMAEKLTSRKKEEMLAVLKFVIDTIESKGINGNNKCMECRNTEEGEFYYFDTGDIGMKYCRGCVHKLNNKLEDVKHEFKEAKNNYVNGALGSFLFGLVGAASVVLFGLLGRVAAASGVIAIYMGDMGYRKFGGKVGGADKWIILGTSIANLVIGNILLLAAEIVKETGNISDILPNMTANPAALSMMLKNTQLTVVISLLFFGYWFWMRAKATKIPVLMKAEKFDK